VERCRECSGAPDAIIPSLTQFPSLPPHRYGFPVLALRALFDRCSAQEIRAMSAGFVTDVRSATSLFAHMAYYNRLTNWSGITSVPVALSHACEIDRSSNIPK